MVERLGIAQLICQNVVLSYADRGKQISDPVFAMVDRLVGIVEGENTPSNLKVIAIKILMEYMCGKPKQAISIEDNTLKITMTKAKE